MDVLGSGTVSCGQGSLGCWLEFNIPFQHKYGYIRDEIVLRESTLPMQKPDDCVTFCTTVTLRVEVHVADG